MKIFCVIVFAVFLTSSCSSQTKTTLEDTTSTSQAAPTTFDPPTTLNHSLDTTIDNANTTIDSTDSTIPSTTKDSAEKENTANTSKPRKSANHPSDIVAMSNWKITLPVSKNDFYGEGGADSAEIKPGDNEKIDVQEIWDIVNHPADGDMVRFRVTAGGARTSSNTKYARTELRQWVDGGSNYWDFSEKHSLLVQGRVMETTPNRPEVVVTQIKAGDDEAARVEWDGKAGWNLVWDEDNKEEFGFLEYDLGDEFLVDIAVDNYEIEVVLKNLSDDKTASKTWKTELSQASEEGGYFKAGAYVQSEAGVDDDADAAAEVWLSKVEIQ